MTTGTSNTTNSSLRRATPAVSAPRGSLSSRFVVPDSPGPSPSRLARFHRPRLTSTPSVDSFQPTLCTRHETPTTHSLPRKFCDFCVVWVNIDWGLGRKSRASLEIFHPSVRLGGLWLGRLGLPRTTRVASPSARVVGARRERPVGCVILSPSRRLRRYGLKGEEEEDERGREAERNAPRGELTRLEENSRLDSRTGWLVEHARGVEGVTWREDE